MSDTMSAYLLSEFHKSPEIGEVPVPVAGTRDVVVKVASSSVNPYDAMAGAGVFRGISEYRFPAVLGRDLAGTVVSVGEGVTQFSPGDEVLGMIKRDYIGDGTFAEYVMVPEGEFIVHRPESLPIAEAGVLGLAGLTALQCLQALESATGDTILVNGATGGVGAFLIQLAAARGLRVLATARAGGDVEHVIDLGAFAAIDATSGTVVEQVAEAYPEGVDGVIDLVSRTPKDFTSMAALAHAGGVAATTLSAARDGAGAGRRVVNVHSSSNTASLREIAELAASGVLRVPIVDSFPLDRIEDAFALLWTGPRGKVALTMST